MPSLPLPAPLAVINAVVGCCTLLWSMITSINPPSATYPGSCFLPRKSGISLKRRISGQLPPASVTSSEFSPMPTRIMDWVLSSLAGIFDSMKLMIPSMAAVFPTPFQMGARESTVPTEGGYDIVHESTDGSCLWAPAQWMIWRTSPDWFRRSETG